MSCQLTARADPNYPGSANAPAVAYCETHHAYLSTGVCDKARIAELETAVLAAKVLLEPTNDETEDAWQVLDRAYHSTK